MEKSENINYQTYLYIDRDGKNYYVSKEELEGLLAQDNDRVLDELQEKINMIITDNRAKAAQKAAIKELIIQTKQELRDQMERRAEIALEILGEKKTVRINNIHLEEDSLTEKTPIYDENKIIEKRR